MKTHQARCVLTLVFVLLLAFDAMADSGDIEAWQKRQGERAPSPARSQGYLSPADIPRVLTFIPSPPEAGSAAFASDEEISRKNLNLQGTGRWKLAAEDAEFGFPQAAEAFSCSLGIPLNMQETPRLCILLFRVLSDVACSSRSIKNYYKRTRPFVINKKPICTPGYQTQLEGNGSYPSGHAAIGWAWALILSEIAPDKADEILARGRAFGDSRLVCNVHWNSDVVEGRVLAAAIVARLHAQQDFRADLEAGKEEVRRAQTKGLKPTRQCVEESNALNMPLR